MNITRISTTSRKITVHCTIIIFPETYGNPITYSVATLFFNAGKSGRKFIFILLFFCRFCSFSFRVTNNLCTKSCVVLSLQWEKPFIHWYNSMWNTHPIFTPVQLLSLQLTSATWKVRKVKIHLSSISNLHEGLPS